MVFVISIESRNDRNQEGEANADVTIAELGCVGQIHLVFFVFLYVLWITRINANIRTEIIMKVRRKTR